METSRDLKEMEADLPLMDGKSHRGTNAMQVWFFFSAVRIVHYYSVGH